MRHRPIKSPRVITHFRSHEGPHEINANVHMFFQDVHLAVMPIGGRTEKHQDFAVRIEGNDTDCEKALDICESLAQYDRYDVTKVICDAVSNIASNLAWEGLSVYEIIYDNNNQGKFYLHNFTTKRLLKIPRYYIQFIPKKDAEYFKKRFVILPSKDIWEIKMPSSLCGQNGYKKILTKLKKYKHLGPKFWRGDMEKQIQTKYFNFQEYVLSSEIYYARVTKQWGWRRRDYSQKNCTEFFSVYHGTTFRWAQAILREHIIGEINKLLSFLRINAKIMVEGLPTSKDILNIRDEITNGKINFMEALDKTTL